MWTFEERLGYVLLLACTAVLAVIVYWYPWYLCTYYSAPDERYGFAIMYAFPFWFIGPGVAGLTVFKLLRAVLAGQRTTGNIALAACGVLLAVTGCSPIIMFACTQDIPMSEQPNETSAGNGAVALSFQSAHPERAVPDHKRWTTA